jgi:predicted GTPase
VEGSRIGRIYSRDSAGRGWVKFIPTKLNSAGYHNLKRTCVQAQHFAMQTSDYQIHIALIGAVSAGKTTLLNALLVARYGDMAMMRTTATETIYYESDTQSITDAVVIYAANASVNKELMGKSAGELKMADLKPLEHVVPPVHDLLVGRLKPGVRLAIHDLPGLNDAHTKNVYHEYVKNNFCNYDIVLLIVDVNSSLNSSDECDILRLIATGIKSNKDDLGINTSLIIIINKCDEMKVIDKQSHEARPIDEEYVRMVEQVERIAKSTIRPILPGVDIPFVCLSAEDAYIYRMYSRNPECKIDDKHRNKFGINEVGKNTWNKMSDNDKANMFNAKLAAGVSDAIELAGFRHLDRKLGLMLSDDMQFAFLLNHLKVRMSAITIDVHATDDDVMDKLFQFANIRDSVFQICELYGKDEISDPFFKSRFEVFVSSYEHFRRGYLTELAMSKDDALKFAIAEKLYDVFVAIQESMRVWLVMSRNDKILIIAKNMNRYLTETLRNRDIKPADVESQLEKFVDDCDDNKCPSENILTEIIANMYQYTSFTWQDRFDFIMSHSAQQEVSARVTSVLVNLRTAIAAHGFAGTNRLIAYELFNQYYINKKFQYTQLGELAKIKMTVVTSVLPSGDANAIGRDGCEVLAQCLSMLNKAYPRQVVDLDNFFESAAANLLAKASK